MYPTNVIQLPTNAELFYKEVLQVLEKARTRFLIGGSLALAHYMHLPRAPKDLDIFLAREDVDATLALLAANGFDTLIVHSHWLAKAYSGDLFIDFIFNSGNGIAQVDDSWFDGASEGEVFGHKVLLCRPEDIVWSKAFIMDRERFDGADIAHLIRDAGKQFDWARLLDKFARHWRVLTAHIMLYQFIYPGDDAVPDWVVAKLLQRAAEEMHAPAPQNRICQGTLLSRDQYHSDVEMYGYADGRLEPEGSINPEELDDYLRAVELEVKARKRLDKEVSRRFDAEQQAIARRVHNKKRKRIA